MPRPECSSTCLAITWLASAAFAQPAVVTGQVTDTLHGKPVPKVGVTLRGRQQGTPPVADEYTVQTDAEGRFLIPQLPPGRYSVSYGRYGYVRPVRNDGSAAMQPPLILQPGQRRALELQLMPAAIISGRTLDEDGDPVRNVTVRALRTVNENGKRVLRVAGQAQSDDHGEYRLFDVSPGAYFLEAAPSTTILSVRLAGERVVGPAPPSGFAITYFPNRRDAASGTRLEAAAGQELRGIDIHLIASALYTLSIREPGLGGSTTYFLRTRNDGDRDTQWISPNTSAPTTGFWGLRSGSYLLIAFSRAIEGGGPQMAARLPIEVVDRDLEIAPPALSPGVEVSGTVQVEAGPAPFPLERVHISLRADSPGFIRDPDAGVTAEGAITLNGVLPQVYALQLSKPVGAYLKSVKLGDRVQPARQVDFSDGVAPLTIVLATDGGIIRGGVENAAGEPAIGTAVILAPEGTLRDRSDLMRSTDTDDAGKYVIKDVAPGEYRIYAWDSSDYSSVLDPDYRKLYQSQSISVSVEPRGDLVVSLKTVVVK